MDPNTNLHKYIEQYMRRLGLRGHVLIEASTIPSELARGARQLHKDLTYLHKCIVLEVQDGTCSLTS